MLYDNDFRLANPPFFPLPSLSCPVTMQFILALLLAPIFGAFFSILPIFTQGQAKYHEKKGISLMKILRIFSHPGTKIHSILSMQKVKMCRIVSVPLPPLRAGIWGVFLSQKAAGKSLLSVCLPFQGGLSVFFI